MTVPIFPLQTTQTSIQTGTSTKISKSTPLVSMLFVHITAMNGNFTPTKITVHIYGTVFDRSTLNFMQIFLTIRELSL